jgi:DNA-binding transcriptional LysR family regulator
MGSLNSTDLAFFAAVAEAEGIGRAADALGTVQSNVTSRIRALEQDLGVTLFQRSRVGVKLTSGGAKLLPFAVQIARLLSDARKAVIDEETPAGSLAIGSLETTAALRLPPILVAYTQSFPDVTLRVETGPTAELVERVRARKIDGAFVSGPIAQVDIEAVPIMDEELVLISSPRLCGWNAIDAFLRMGAQARVIVFRVGCSYRQRMDELLARRGFVGVQYMEMGTLDGIIGCASAGVGVALLPRGVVESAVADERLSVHTLPDHSGQAETLFIRRCDSFQSSAMRRFIDTALAVSSVSNRRAPETMTSRSSVIGALPQPMVGQ